MLLFFLLTTSITASAAIFGVDDRVSVRAGTREDELARSTAVAVLSANYVETRPGKLHLETMPSSEFLCSKERFSGEPSLSYACTGFLVGPDLLATAGHCMVNVGEERNETETYCRAFSWLFDYRAEKDGTTRTEDIPTDRLYTCKQVVYAAHLEGAPYTDFALVQLTRPVVGRGILKLNDAKLTPAGRLKMVGYPLGLPAKLSVNAKILLDNPERSSLITNLDAFEGNSGSPVFNDANEVVGILVGGTPIESLVPDGQCHVFNRCDEGGKTCTAVQDTSMIPSFQRTGSEVQRITPLKELVEKFQGQR